MARRTLGILAALVVSVAFAGSAAAQATSPLVERYFRLHRPHARTAVAGPAWHGGASRYLRRTERRSAPLSIAAPAAKAPQAAPAPAAADTEAAKATAALSDVDRAVLSRINSARAQQGLRPLVVSAGLTAAARQHSVEMVSRGYFGHESADGSSFDRRVRRFYRGLRSAGENIAFGVPDLSPGDAMELWLNSPAHRRNILDPRWREIGISVVHVDSASGPDYQGDPTTVATTVFGRR